jgi:hypothetical protein
MGDFIKSDIQYNIKLHNCVCVYWKKIWGTFQAGRQSVNTIKLLKQFEW